MGAKVTIFDKILNSTFHKGLRHSAMWLLLLASCSVHDDDIVQSRLFIVSSIHNFIVK